ncbi:hypothetical protein DXV76_13980 [Rhodobacteraceae bacterium CCMM004]|nr:hypothetical protein DXV76_13980 [Rhodobacteraceae bacterium CCMM004]
MPAAVHAACDRALPGRAPLWVHLFPMGEFKARDGRRFRLDDPDAVIATFRAGKVDLPVDYEHQSETAADRRVGPAPAAGWIKELRRQEGGLWGRVEWTAQARSLIAGKAYRYLSPAFYHGAEDGNVIELKGAALVHRPALDLVALASKQEPAMDPRSDLIAQLALPDDASDEDIWTAALTRLRETPEGEPDPARYVPVEALEELLRDRAAGHARVSEAQASAKVQAACAQGYITPAMTDWALSLCRKDPDAFDGFLAKAVPSYAHLETRTVPSGPPPATGTTDAGGDEVASLCRQLGLDAAKFRG